MSGNENNNFITAVDHLNRNLHVKLPEWDGYWFKATDGKVKVMTYDGDILALEEGD